MVKKRTVYLKRPVYVGFTVMEIGKYVMYSFHYDLVVASSDGVLDCV